MDKEEIQELPVMEAILVEIQQTLDLDMKEAMQIMVMVMDTMGK